MLKIQTQGQLSNTIQKKSVILTSDQIQISLDNTTLKMTQAQRSGNYMQAENYKKFIEQLKKDLAETKLKEASTKHKKQKKELEKNHQKQISTCKQFWEQKKKQMTNQGINTKEEAQKKHKCQISKLQEQMEVELSKTFKESSECLNFRKIEENMAKQKKYVQAHKTHKRIEELQIKQREQFAKQKKAKIQLAKQTLIQKQHKQAEAIDKKVKTALFQLQKDLNSELQKLKHKHQNNLKQLKSQQQKQILSMKGQFKSKVGLASSASRSRLFTLHN